MDRQEIEARFPRGARVRLSVGGPIMIVRGYTGLRGYLQVVCKWFARRKFEKRDFTPEALLNVDDHPQVQKTTAESPPARSPGGRAIARLGRADDARPLHVQ
jgi:uncharacterized protein YodC (DUF2158 family)